MTLMQGSKEQEVAMIAESLNAEFGGRIPMNRVAAEADRAYTELSATSRVPGFIPILALRRARAALGSAPTG